MNRCHPVFRLQRARIVVLLAALQLSGCATMFHNGPQSVEIQPSDPVPVEVEISHGPERRTTTLPARLNIYPSTFKQLRVTVTDPCYKPSSIQVPRRIHPAYYTNIFNLHGLYIDILTGYAWALEENITVPAQPRKNAARICDARESLAEPARFAIVNLGDRHQHALGMSFSLPLFSSRDGVDVNPALGNGIGGIYDFRLDADSGFQLFWEFGGEDITLPTAGDEQWAYASFSRDALGISYRYFPDQAGWYAGVGTAWSSLSMYYETGDALTYDSFHADADHSPIFVEAGIESGRGALKMFFTARLDLADLGLMTRDTVQGVDEEGLATAAQRDILFTRFRQAQSLSQLSTGLAIRF